MNRESKSLPIEIIDNIFQYLPQKSLMECQRVCQLWCPYATRYFMNQVTFCSQNEISRFLKCQPRMTNAVKKIKIPFYWKDEDNMNELSKQNIQQLMMLVPNLEELQLDEKSLPICYLNDIDLPINLKSIYINYVFETTQESCEYIKLLTKLRGTIKKFNMIYDDELFENLNLVTFFSFFPKLTELGTDDIDNISRLTDCLPIIQAIPSLKSLCIFIIEDIDSDFNNTIQYKERLNSFEMLNITVADFLPNTLLFIVHNFVGLKEVKVDFEYNETFIDQLLKSLELPDKVNIDIFTFDMSSISFVSRSIDLFFELLSIMIGPKKVVLTVSGDSKWSTYETSKKFNHISELEIHVKLKSRNVQGNDNMSISLDIFSNLKTLRLNNWCGTWYSEHNVYLIDLPLLSLEALHVNVIPLMMKPQHPSFMLVVETNTTVHFYEVSTINLNAKKILQFEPENIQKNDSVKLYIKIHGLQNLHLFIYNRYKTITLQ